MYAVVRTYSGQGAAEVFDLIGQREADVKALIGGLPVSSATRPFAAVMAA